MGSKVILQKLVPVDQTDQNEHSPNKNGNRLLFIKKTEITIE